MRETMSDGWIRAIRKTRNNRLTPGSQDKIPGPWHVVLAQGQGQSWCGKQFNGTNPTEWAPEEPTEPDAKFCDDCMELWRRGTPFPRPNPPEFNRTGKRKQ